MTDKIESEAFDKERALKTIHALLLEINELLSSIKAKDAAMDEVIDVLTYLKDRDERIKTAHKEAIIRLLDAKKATLAQVRLNTAIEKGIPIEMAHFLSGETPEEIEKDAARLLASYRK